MKVNAILALLALTGGLTAAFTNISQRNHYYPDWKYAKERINGEKVRFISAPYLAQRLYQKDAGMRILDTREQEAYDTYHIPAAIHFSGKDDLPPVAAGDLLVLYGSEDDERVTELTRELDRKVVVLKGGMDSWNRQVLFPDFAAFSVRNAERLEQIIRRSRYFGGSPRQMQLLNISVRESQFREGC